MTIDKIKAIIMDGDGSTLVHKTTELPDNLRDLMLSNRHIKWIMATGRSLDLLKRTPIADYLSTDVPHILDGGSRLMYLDGVDVYSHFIKLEVLKHFFSIVKLDAINYLYYSPDGISAYAYTLSDSFRFDGDNVNITRNIDEFANWTYNEPPTKLLVNAHADLTFDGLHYYKNDDNIDITAEGVNKGSACVDLLTRLEIKPHEAAFVFNDKNDLPVIEHSALSDLITIKVGGWLPQVKPSFSVSNPYEVADILSKLVKS